MSIKRTAFFVRRPQTIENLRRPHLPEREHEYRIVKSIALSGIAYENFSLDLLADRQFIEKYTAPCSEGEIWKCLFVHRHGHSDGILVIPAMNSFVKWAAYIMEK